MKYPFLLILLFQIPNVFGQEAGIISIGTYDSLYSRVLDERRDIQVYLPPNYSPEKIYPVIYVLDGDRNFHPMTGVVYHLSLNYVVPEMIVVGILNTNRVRDFTPTHDPNSHDSTNGGGETFVSFLKNELIPYVESRFSTAPYNILVGHSAGGLLATHIMLNHTDLFTSYITIDPSLWWDNMKLIQQSGKIFNEDKFKNRNLYVAIANSMPAEMTDTAVAIRDTTNATIGIRSILIFEDTLRKSANAELRWGAKYYENEYHGSLPLLAFYDALKFLFDFYQRPSFQTLTDSTGTILENHFQNVSKRMGYEILPSESEFNGLAWRSWAMENNFDRALIFLNQYIRLYPDSPNAYMAMGRFYEAKGEQENAEKYFSKARRLMN